MLPIQGSRGFSQSWQIFLHHESSLRDLYAGGYKATISMLACMHAEPSVLARHMCGPNFGQTVRLARFRALLGSSIMGFFAPARGRQGQIVHALGELLAVRGIMERMNYAVSAVLRMHVMCAAAQMCRHLAAVSDY